MNSSWLTSEKPTARQRDERFENLPPLETIHPDELKNYTRQQLSWYLEQRGIEPEETKPKMKAQLREVLKEIRVDNPQAEKMRAARMNSSSNLTRVISLNTNRSSSKGSGTAQINVTVNFNMLQQRAASNIIPCRLPITKASHRNARPFLNLQVRSTPLHDIPITYETNVKHLEYLFGCNKPLRARLMHLKSKSDLFSERKEFLESLKQKILVEESKSTETDTRKYFKQL